MTLRIIAQADQVHVDNIIVTIYKAPGHGGSSLAFTAADPLLLDFDAGLHRVVGRRDAAQITSWEDAIAINKDDIGSHRTLIVDTVGRAIDLCASDIMTREPKLGYGGALSLQGFGRLKAQFPAWLKRLRSFGVDLVLMAHLDESRRGDELIERIDAQGASKQEIYKISDAMGRLAINNGKRMLFFSPTDTSFGKNPAALPPIEVPAYPKGRDCLAVVIQQIKDHINAQSEEQRELGVLMEAWITRVNSATSAKKVNDLIAESEKLDARVTRNAKKYLADKAASYGYVFDKLNGRYAETEKAS